jgi:prepilin-type N-terminal cleavage/methylation domain-containing protein/prepilin-type processing-associated H-X9-DG protein
MKSAPRFVRGLTLLELLVAIAIIAILTALLFPALRGVRDSSQGTACVSNLRQIGAAIAAYAADHDGRLPTGPKAPPFTSPSNLYPSTGAPTSLISLRTGEPVALGLLLEKYLAQTPKVLFCPGSDQPEDAEAELEKVGKTQAQCSYYYRHCGNTQLFDNPKVTIPDVRLQALGDNRNGVPIRALVIDTMFLCPPELDTFNVKPRTYHRARFANILFADGHVVTRSNTDARFTVDVSATAQLRSSFDKILQVFEQADTEP